ncbi:MAG: HD domain-containing protein [Desulfobacteraceae bacterium]|nr:HD domain-containing protein [Desulfobacteraceae bacterium]
MNTTELTGILDFLRHAEQLKNTIRSAWTSEGRPESVAEHTWRLCLMTLLFAKNYPDVDYAKLVKMCIIHDLGEVINGDIPAIEQTAGESKALQERQDLLSLLKPLPKSLRSEITALWDEYEEAASPEAKLAKALDKLETILQHNQGRNPEDFDYRFNLEYGRKYTSEDPLIASLRLLLDQETQNRAMKARPRS